MMRVAKKKAPRKPTRADLDARDRILRAAIKLFAERGLHATTTRQIASAAGVNLSLISYYFGGKDGLYEAIIREHARRVERDVAAALTLTAGDKLTREVFVGVFEGLIENMIEDHLREPDMKRILSLEVSAGMPHSLKFFDEVFDRIVRDVVSLVARGKEAGFVRAELDPLFYIKTLVCAVDGYLLGLNCHTRMTRDLPKLPEGKSEILRQLKMMYLEGVIVK